MCSYLKGNREGERISICLMPKNTVPKPREDCRDKAGEGLELPFRELALELCWWSAGLEQGHPPARSGLCIPVSLLFSPTSLFSFWFWRAQNFQEVILFTSAEYRCSCLVCWRTGSTSEIPAFTLLSNSCTPPMHTSHLYQQNVGSLHT